MTRLGSALVAAAALAASAAPAAADVPGTLSQVGCMLDGPATPDCAGGRALSDAAYLTISPDGRHLYTPGRGSDAIAILSRDPGTGLLTQAEGEAGCVGGGSDAPAECGDAIGLDRPTGIVVSGDGSALFVASTISDTVTAFSRDPQTGGLRQTACFQDAATRAPIAGCTPAAGLDGAVGLVLTPDARTLYVAAEDASAIVALARDPAAGTLSPIGCVAAAARSDTATCVEVGSLAAVRSLAASPDGRSVYAAAPGVNAVVAFARDPGTGGLAKVGCISGDDGTGQDPACAAGTALGYAQHVAVSPDGRFVYVSATGSRALVGFARDPGTSALAQLPPPDGCRSDFDAGPITCNAAPGLSQSLGITMTPDGGNLYTGSFTYGSIVGFVRDPQSGLVAPLGRCISASDARCERGKGLDRAGFVGLSPDARFLYANATGASGVAIFARHFAVQPATVAAAAVRARRKRVRVPLACPAGFLEGCFGRVRLAVVRVRGGLRMRTVAGPARFDLPSGNTASVRLRLRQKAVRRLKIGRRAAVRAIAVSHDGSGPQATSERAVRLRR